MQFKSIALAALLIILFSACSNLGNASLDGTSWELYAISKHRPVDGSAITISFEDGRVTGHSGCNSYGSEYQVNGNKIDIGMLESTLMACTDPAKMEQETMFLRFLGQAQRIEFADGQLLIYWSDHEALTFIPVDEKN